MHTGVAVLKVGLLSVVALLLLAGCNLIPIQGLTGSGNLVTEEYDLDGFTEIDASSAFEVIVTRGDEFAVTLTADDNIMDRVEVDVRGERLVLGMRDLTIMLGQITLRAEVTLPELTAITLSGASRATFDEFDVDGAFDAEASGASTISGAVNADSVRVDISGASKATLTGSARTLDALASGASTADLRDLIVEDARVEASGASTIRVHATSELDAQASGASTVRYSGDPSNVREDSSGASNVEPD